MKNFTTKWFSLLMLVSLLSGNAHASHQDYDGSMNSGDCCMRQYECGCNPLYCGVWDFQIQAGISPTRWVNKQPSLAISCAFLPFPVITLFNGSALSFKASFRLPWVIGGQIGCAVSDNARVYAEVNYIQAKGRKNSQLLTDYIFPIVGALPVQLNFGTMKIVDAYVGARYYWNRWSNRASFFMGGKIGLIHHFNVSDVLVAGPAGDLIPAPVSIPLAVDHRADTVFSGGGHLGLDFCFGCNWSLVFTAEAVASAGPAQMQNLSTSAPVGPLSAVIPLAMETELRFPITFAVRYSF